MPSAPADEPDRLLTDHGEAVWRLIVRILGSGVQGNSGHDAADCFQQTFVEYFSLQRKSNNIRHAGAMLKRIAVARAIDLVRRRVRERRRTQGGDELFMVAAASLAPEAVAEESELLDDLRAALADLPKPQAAAFVLTQMEDLANGSAARVMGVSVSHLGVLLHRARAALRERLESHHPLRESRP